MKVNESRNDAIAFFQQCSQVIDNKALFTDGIPPTTLEYIEVKHDRRDEREPEADQQPAKANLPRHTDNPFEEGTTVRTNLGGIPNISIITKVITTKEGLTMYKVRNVNEKDEHIIKPTELEAIRPEPSDVPLDPRDVDAKLLEEELSEYDVAQLWKGKIDDTVPEEDRVTLYWHHRLRHAPLVTLRRLAMRGVLPSCIKRVMKMPLCAACAFAAAHRRNWRSKKKATSEVRRKTDTNPGDGTSADHIVSRQSGLIPQSTGILTHERFWGAVIFVDHATDFVYGHPVKGITSQETLDAKHAYERKAKENGVVVNGYHADNLHFNSNKFMGDCVSAGQRMTFCGVGAHHQNGVVERKNRELTEAARTVLLHAQRKWHKVIKPILWPYALLSAIERHNHLSLDKNGRSPMEKFSSTHGEIDITDFHTWGCPVFVLDAENQSGKLGTPKWDPKSHAGIYLGHSPCHARSVSLILNLATGLISPQYHVIYDEEFTTVDYLESNIAPPNWVALSKHALEHSILPQVDLEYSWLHPDNSNITELEKTKENETENLKDKTTSASPSIKCPNSQNFGEEERNKISKNFVNLDTLGLRRSPRIAQNSRKINYGLMVLALSSFVSTCPQKLANCYQARKIAYADFLDANFDGSQNSTSPLAQIYSSTKSNNEVFTLKEMLAEPDREEFMKAMEEEVESIFREKSGKEFHEN